MPRSACLPVSVAAAMALLLAAMVLPGCSMPASSNQRDAAAAPIRLLPTGQAAADGGRNKLAVRQCGRALGIAVRCDLILDDKDFAILRFAVVQGLGNGPVRGSEQLTELVDLSALDRITTLAACSIPAAEAVQVEAAARERLLACAGGGDVARLVSANPANRSGEPEMARKITKSLAERSASQAVRERASSTPRWGRLTATVDELLTDMGVTAR